MQALPLTVRRSLELIGLVVLALVVIEGHQIIMPLLMAFFMSIVLLPVFRFLRRKKFPELLAIFCSLLVMVTITGAIIFFIYSQVRPVVDDFPAIKATTMKHIDDLSTWFSQKTGMSASQQNKIVDVQTQKILDSTGDMLGGAANSLGATLIFFGLLPIYTFLILYYRNILVKFVYLWFPAPNHPEVRETINDTESIIKSYIGGLLIQITYMTILLGGLLLLLGIKHALLIGIIFAILNLIPYIGALFGNIIGVLLTLSSSEELTPVITVLITIAIVQFLDNNILMPRIVGGKVRINALASLAGVFIGGALAGISGMFLSLPLIAVFKVIFDHTTQFKQWGVLFGDELPKEKKSKKILIQKKSSHAERKE